MSQPKQWYEKQLRILQTVLREPDVVNYDARSVAAYMEQIHANCIIINGGGIVDFFRHDLVTANPNPFMTSEDVLKDLTEACHEKGMKVVVRVDFRGVDKKIYELRPDWFSMNEQGDPKIRDNPLHSAIFQPCYQSVYRNEHAYRFIDYLFEHYDIDGIWENSYTQDGICYCKRCSDRYFREVGKELPRGGQFMDSSYDEYRQWKADCVMEHLRDCRAVVKKYGEDKAYAAEIFGLYHDRFKANGHDLYAIKDHFDFLVTPLFTANHEPMNGPSTLIKFLKSLSPDKTPVMLFGHLGTNNDLRYISSAAQETRLWMWEAISAGGSFWNCVFNGQHPGKTYDRRNALLCADIYEFMELNEEVLSGQETAGEVSVLYSRATNAALGNPDRSKDAYLTHMMGLEQVLTDMHVQYRLLTDDKLNGETLAATKVLILANAACLSDREMDIIREYVRSGGKLIATHQTSLRQTDGTLRHDYALGDVLGCAFTGIVKDNSQWGYQYVRGEHPLTRGFENTSLLASWGPQQLVRVTSQAAEAPVTYVPQIFPQPPERSWLRSYETEYPTLLLNRFGQGESVFFPYGVDRNVWQHGHNDFSELLKKALNYLLQGDYTVKTNAPASVHLSLNRSGGDPKSYVLHAVNTTAAPRRPVLQTIPVHDVQVDIKLKGTRLAGFTCLHKESDIQCSGAAVPSGDGELLVSVTIPRLQEYAALHFTIE
ncbi:alpha-amylase family protein [Paenibacillus thalictri]|nr:alpha-amylase family protein [Paenibacillus thalictri]